MSKKKRKQRRNISSKKDEKIHVFVRVKPLGAGGGGGEIEAKEKNCKTSMIFDENNLQCGDVGYSYPYRVVPPTCNQQGTYDSVIEDLIPTFLNGVNVNILGYGQTGSGKTHTLYGPPNLVSKYYNLFQRKKIEEEKKKKRMSSRTRRFVEGKEEVEGENKKMNDESVNKIKTPEDERLEEYEKDLGIFPRAALQILDIVKKKKAEGVKCSLTATMVEVHCLEIYDILNKKRSIGFEKNDCKVRGEVEWNVETEVDMIKLISMSEKRTTGATLMNDTSSRSHLVVTLIYCERNEKTNKYRESKFVVIDLGGSERAHEAHGKDVNLKFSASAIEGMMINLTLFILLWCVEKFSKKKRRIIVSRKDREKERKDFVMALNSYWWGIQIPCLIYGSFLGTSSTRLFINVSQAPRNTFQSNYALNFGKKAAKLTMKPQRNELMGYNSSIRVLRKKIIEYKRALERMKDSNSEKFKVKRRNEIILFQNKLRRLLKLK